MGAETSNLLPSTPRPFQTVPQWRPLPIAIATIQNRSQHDWDVYIQGSAEGTLEDEVQPSQSFRLAGRTSAEIKYEYPCGRAGITGSAKPFSMAHTPFKVGGVITLVNSRSESCVVNVGLKKYNGGCYATFYRGVFVRPRRNQFYRGARLPPTEYVVEEDDLPAFQADLSEKSIAINELPTDDGRRVHANGSITLY